MCRNSGQSIINAYGEIPLLDPVDARLIFHGSGPAALSPTSKVLASASLGNGIVWLDIKDQSTTSRMKSKSSAHSLEVAFLASNTVVVGSENGGVEIMKSGKANALQILHHGMLSTLLW